MKKKIKIESLLIKERIVGVVGGVGPEASNKFCEFLIKNKKANSDQEHLTFIHYCNPKIPDRTKYILGEGENPKPEIIRSCKILQKAGASFIVVPCCTSHVFLKEIQEYVNIPIIDMIRILVRDVMEKYPKIKNVGILATSGSLKKNIYQNYFKDVEINAILPSAKEQEELVMNALYGSGGIKAGNKNFSKKKLMIITEKLIKQGAEAIILGCTEISLVLKQKEFDVPLIDPMEITANAVIEYLKKESAQTSRIIPFFKQ
ncbi:MAG: amino acid racemase [Patescibacteria group bacterium]|jgi:aspartate racemase